MNQKLSSKIGAVHFYALAEDKLRGKNDDQLRRHKNPRLKATRNFIDAVGDIPLRQVTTKELFACKRWWLARIRDGEIQPSSANKDFDYLCVLWRSVAQAEGFQPDVNTQDLAFQDVLGLEAVRPPFSDNWIKCKLLAEGALKGMNTDARLIVLGWLVFHGIRTCCRCFWARRSCEHPWPAITL